MRRLVVRERDVVRRVHRRRRRLWVCEVVRNLLLVIQRRVGRRGRRVTCEVRREDRRRGLSKKVSKELTIKLKCSSSIKKTTHTPIPLPPLPRTRARPTPLRPLILSPHQRISPPTHAGKRPMAPLRRHLPTDTAELLLLLLLLEQRVMSHGRRAGRRREGQRLERPCASS